MIKVIHTTDDDINGSTFNIGAFCININLLSKILDTDIEQLKEELDKLPKEEAGVLAKIVTSIGYLNHENKSIREKLKEIMYWLDYYKRTIKNSSYGRGKLEERDRIKTILGL